MLDIVGDFMFGEPISNVRSMTSYFIEHAGWVALDTYFWDDEPPHALYAYEDKPYLDDVGEWMVDVDESDTEKRFLHIGDIKSMDDFFDLFDYTDKEKTYFKLSQDTNMLLIEIL